MQSHDESSPVETTSPHQLLLLPPSEGLTTEKAEEQLIVFGRNELVEETTPGWLIFVRGLWGPMPIAIWIAIIVEYALKSWIDGSILLFIQLANATIGWYETMKAGNAVAALKGALKPEATAKRDGKWQVIDAGSLVPGDLVKLGAGSAVPADCSINEGEIGVDEAALTGESLPVTMNKDHIAKMGSTVVRGEVEATVQFTGCHTFFGKAASLIQSVPTDLGNIHQVLIHIMSVLTLMSLILCLIVFIYLMAHLKTGFSRALEFAVILLIVSVPLAIEIVVTTTLAVGSHKLAEKGVIVTRLTSIELMSSLNMLCSDKTGTMTTNKMEIQPESPTYVEGYDFRALVQHAALAAKWKEPPRDALDTMVLGAADLVECNEYEQLDFLPFDPRTKRTEATLKGPHDEVFKVAKGAPLILLEMCRNKPAIDGHFNETMNDLGSRGIRCLAVARTIDGEWMMLGLLTFLDPPRPDTKATIDRARHFGVPVKMVTGDQELIAREMARILGLGTHILPRSELPSFPASGNPEDIPHDLGEKYGDKLLAADGFAGVFPEHKFLIVEALRQKGYTVGMTGDGVNDAPAMKRADVGIAVHGATDAARAAADMVLTQPGLSFVVEAMIVAREVFMRMQSFLLYRCAATLQIIWFFFIALFALEPSTYNPAFPEYFRVPVLMLMIITLLNDGTLMTIGYDNVIPSADPQKWNLRVLFLVATVLASVSCASSLLMLWFGLDSGRENSLFYKLGIPTLEYGEVVCSIYLKISISDFMTLFSSRTGQHPFFHSVPSPMVLMGAALALTASTVLACSWPRGTLNDIPTLGISYNSKGWALPIFVWIYCFICWVLQDALKVLSYKVIYAFDVFNYRTMSHPTYVEPRPHRTTSILTAVGGTMTSAGERIVRRSLSKVHTSEAHDDLNRRRAVSTIVIHSRRSPGRMRREHDETHQHIVAPSIQQEEHDDYPEEYEDVPEAEEKVTPVRGHLLVQRRPHGYSAIVRRQAVSAPPIRGPLQPLSTSNGKTPHQDESHLPF